MKRSIKRIIEGKKYNTKTAMLLDDISINSCHQSMAQIFKKRTGELFIVTYELGTDTRDTILTEYHGEFFTNILSRFNNLPDNVLNKYPE